MFKRRLPAASTDAVRTRPSTGGRLIYAIGDVHGRRDLLDGLLTAILKDLIAEGGGARPLIVFIGDLIDRGPASREVVEAVLELQAHRALDVRVLKGNHEQLALDFLRDPQAGGAWLDLGGRQTLASYGIEVGPLDNLADTRNAFREALGAAHLRLLTAMELFVEAGDYLFVHAGLRPGVSLRDQSERDLLWIREPFLSADPHRFDRIVVHGHTPAEAHLGEQRICIDSGAYYSGSLTCLRLEGETQRLITYAHRRKSLRSLLAPRKSSVA
jgi:serine/threonine protein phosphatase 1